METIEIEFVNNSGVDQLAIMLCIADALKDMGVGVASGHLPNDVMKKIRESNRCYLMIKKVDNVSAG